MNKQIVYAIIFLLMQCNQIDATQLIQGNVPPIVAEKGCPTNVTTTFKTSVQTTAYDRANGIFWAGLESGAATYAVSTFQRTIDASQIPFFRPRATDSTLNNDSISMLTMATNTGDTCSQVAGVASGAANVFLLTLQNKVTMSSPLNIYNPTLNQDGNPAESINGLAANGCFIFAAVTDGFFGDPNSGIAVVAINQTTNALNQTTAVPGDMGIKAQQLDNLSPFIRIAGDAINRHPSITGNEAKLVWDDQLGRLYIGVSLQSDPLQLTDDGLRSIVVAQVGCCPEKGTLPLFDFAPEAAFNNNTNNLVGVTLSSDGQNLVLTATEIAIMHASTGPSYLILNGGNGTATNQIFALPLVDLCDPTNITQGVLANKNEFNATTHHFEIAAVNNNDLTTSADLFAQVGAGPLPINTDQGISELFVVGDAVYVSFKIPQDNNNETGILYSQALFNYQGEIESWTPWSKRVWPICGFPDSPSNSQVSFFAIDAFTGKVIAVDGNPQETVRITEWVNEQPTCDPCENCCSLPFVLNESLCSGAYSVLDLDQSTRGIGPTIPSRYALFGGTNKVDIALVSTSRATSAPFDINASNGQPYPQRVTCNFCDPENFKETTLPDGAGCVTSLEYARRTLSEGATNYFFAGTQNGLFVFAHQDGSGFTVNELSVENSGIIDNGSWQAVATITGPIIDIKTSGNTLYVLTSATSCETPLQSTLLSIPFTNNINTMFAAGNISTIAQSGATSPTAILQNTLLFTAIDIIQTTTTGSPQEQLVLATNNGIFQSQAINGVQSVTTAADAEWTSLNNNSLFYGIGSVDNAYIKSTDWPFNAQDSCGCGTFERSSIYQLNGSDNVNTFQFVPSFFNYYINSCCQDDNDCCPPKLFEKICYFWSDGGRRFFIIAPTNSTIAGIPCCGKKRCCCCQLEQLRFLEVTPFNWCEWNVCNASQTILKDCVLRNTPVFYWVRQIGMTGILMAGTPYGVVALE